MHFCRLACCTLSAPAFQFPLSGVSWSGDLSLALLIEDGSWLRMCFNVKGKLTCETAASAGLCNLAIKSLLGTIARATVCMLSCFVFSGCFQGVFRAQRSVGDEVGGRNG